MTDTLAREHNDAHSRAVDPEAIAGRILIRVQAHGERIERVTIESSRRTDIAGVLEGRRVDEALTMLPLLFSVCGTAQAAAGVAAVERAQGREVDTARALHRELCVLEETAREHALRLTLDWPQRLGLAPAGLDALRRASGALQGALRRGRPWQPGGEGALPSAADVIEAVAGLETAVTESVLGRSPDEWLWLRTLDQFLTWTERGETPAARVAAALSDPQLATLGASTVAGLPDVSLDALDARLAADDGEFRARPTWNDQVHETGPLSRQRRHPLIEALAAHHGYGALTRLTARLVELAGVTSQMRRIARELDDPAPRRASSDRLHHCGIAAVEAARGRLVHHVALDGERIARYRILAPTEWNFHPRGALAQGLEGVTAPAALGVEGSVGVAVTALDPCVAHQITIEPVRHTAHAT